MIVRSVRHRGLRRLIENDNPRFLRRNLVDRVRKGTVKLSRIRPFCGRILLDQRLRINDLAVAPGGENAAKLLNFTVPFADMRQTFGLQAADILAYEMVKELRNQDVRREDRMRWPLDQILSEPESPRGKMLKYNTAEMLQAQAAGQWDRRRGDVLQRNLDESLRILRDKSAAFKRRFRARDM